MSKKGMGSIDPANILDPGVARGARARSAGRLGSPPSNAQGGVDFQPPVVGSPVVQVEPNLLLSPAGEIGTSPREDEFEETPFNQGRHLIWRGSKYPPTLANGSMSSDGSDSDIVGSLQDELINVRQEVDRYANDHHRSLNWRATVWTERNRVMALIDHLRKGACETSDAVLVEELDVAMTQVDSAREEWSRKACAPDPPKESQESHSTPILGISRLDKGQNSGIATVQADSEFSHNQKQVPTLGEEGLRSVTQLRPVFVNRELTNIEDVNRSVELSEFDDNNTWIKTGEFVIEIPSFSAQPPLGNTAAEDFKRYDEKMQRCIEGISQAMQSHAQIQVVHAQRIKKLEDQDPVLYQYWSVVFFGVMTPILITPKNMHLCINIGVL